MEKTTPSKRLQPIIERGLVSCTETELKTKQSLTWAEAETIAEALFPYGRWLSIQVGDFLNEVCVQFPQQWEQLLPTEDRALGTYLNYMRVSRQVPPQVRQPLRFANFSLHAEVSPLHQDPKQQQELLQKAVEGCWTVKQLRECIYGRRALRPRVLTIAECPKCGTLTPVMSEPC